MRKDLTLGQLVGLLITFGFVFAAGYGWGAL